MSYEILVLDIDGTLTNSKKEITQKTMDAIVSIQKLGKQVVLASGRPTPGVLKIAKILGFDRNGGWVLSYNGAHIMDCKTNEVIYQAVLPQDMLSKLHKEAVDHKTGIITYEDDVVLVGNGFDEYNQLEARINELEMKEITNFGEYVTFPVHKCLLTSEAEHLAKVEVDLKEKYGQQLNIYRSEPFFLELMPHNIDKAYSLEILLEHLGLSREQMICCGDGYNDVSMIKYAGLGVAMANAQEVVKQVADYITTSNDEDGVAAVIKKFWDV